MEPCKVKQSWNKIILRSSLNNYINFFCISIYVKFEVMKATFVTVRNSWKNVSPTESSISDLSAQWFQVTFLKEKSDIFWWRPPVSRSRGLWMENPVSCFKFGNHEWQVFEGNCSFSLKSNSFLDVLDATSETYWQ